MNSRSNTVKLYPTPRSIRYLLLSLSIAASVAGCGGGGGSARPASTGTAALTIKWPARTTRLIPVSANSITVTITEGSQSVSTQTVPRPSTGDTSTVKFTDLPYGSLSVSAAAYPTTDGTGVAQATGAGTLTEVVGTPGSITISLASTVAKLAISPNPITCGKGLTTNLTVSAVDASGNVVLLAVGNASEPIAWSTGNAKIAMVTGTGTTAVLQGIDQGSTTVTASFVTNDAGSTVTTQNPVPVTAGSGTVTIQ